MGEGGNPRSKTRFVWGGGRHRYLINTREEKCHRCTKKRYFLKKGKVKLDREGGFT